MKWPKSISPFDVVKVKPLFTKADVLLDDVDENMSNK